MNLQNNWCVDITHQYTGNGVSEIGIWYTVNVVLILTEAFLNQSCSSSHKLRTRLASIRHLLHRTLWILLQKTMQPPITGVAQDTRFCFLIFTNLKNWLQRWQVYPGLASEEIVRSFVCFLGRFQKFSCFTVCCVSLGLCWE